MVCQAPISATTRSLPWSQPGLRAVVFALLSMVVLLTAPTVSAQEDKQNAEPSILEKVMRHLDRVQYIDAGRGLGSVTLGMPLRQVLALWGNPWRSERTGLLNRTTTMIYRNDLDTYVLVSGDKAVEEIGIEGNTIFETREGIRFGTPRHQVKMVYGAGEEKEQTLRYKDKGIEFIFRRGLVFQIRLFRPVNS